MLWFVTCYLSKRSDTHYARVLEHYGQDPKLPVLFKQLLQTDSFIQFLLGTDPQFQSSYWSMTGACFYGTSIEYWIKVLEALLDVGRIDDYLETIVHANYHQEKIPDGIIKKVLYAADETPASRRIGGQLIRAIFDHLRSILDEDDPELIDLEMMFISQLGSYGTERRPLAIYEKMISDPTYTVDLLAQFSLPDDQTYSKMETEIPDILSKFKKGRVLFENFRTIPGARDTEILDELYLKEWCNKVRDIAGVRVISWQQMT